MYKYIYNLFGTKCMQNFEKDFDTKYRFRKSKLLSSTIDSNIFFAIIKKIMQEITIFNNTITGVQNNMISHKNQENFKLY